jgi:hypothetical protein
MKFALYVALFFFFDYCIAQDNQFYIKPEVLIGKTIPSYTLFTHKKPKTVLGASLFKNNYNKSKNWQKTLNYPKTGISVYFTNYGDKAKGNSFSVLPFINFYVNQKKLYSLKFAFGASYFTKQFDVDKNPNFNAISTKLTWCLQAGIYRKILYKNKNEFFLGLVYFHNSNGHIKLPNEGFNTASISLSTDFKISSNPLLQNENIKDKKSIKRFPGRFVNIRYGKGFHVLQETTNRIKQVEIVSISGGIYYKEIVRLSIGAAYRFYQHYYDYILDNQLQKYLDNPTTNASNVYVFLGAELLLGNVGIDWEGGLNLYKPFYETHYQLDGAELNFNYKLKKIILGRLGLKLYAIATSKKPKHNVYLSGNINSNFGQADFSEISIGIIKRLR